MPKAVYPISDVQQTFVRPVVLDISRQVLNQVGLPEETQIIFTSETNETFQPGSTISNEPNFNQFDSSDRWTVTVLEKAQEEHLLNSSVDYMDNPPIFKDSDTDTEIRPAYIAMDYALSVSCKFRDRNLARKWTADIRSRTAMNREFFVHGITYSYLIPTSAIEVTKEIHRLREQVEPYGQTYEEYWKEYVTPKATLLTNIVGENAQWAIPESQGRVVGFFDFTDQPEEGSKDDERSSWTVEFTYTVKLQVPMSVWMSYPLMIHNQLISKEYRQTSLPPREEDKQQYFSSIAANMAWFERDQEAIYKGLPGFAIPEFDEFMPVSGTIPFDTLRIVTILTSIDTTNPLELMSFDDLGDYSIDTDLLNFMRVEAPFMTKPRQSVFSVMVFKDKLPLPDGAYSVTPDLKVVLRDIPSLRSTFHVRLALYQRPRLLPPAAKIRMRENCSATIKILLTLEPSVANLNPSCMIQNFMSEQVFHKLTEHVDTAFDTRWDKQHIQFNTVMTFAVNGHRRK